MALKIPTEYHLIFIVSFLERATQTLEIIALKNYPFIFCMLIVELQTFPDE